MKPALAFVMVLILPATAWSEEPPIKVDLAPLLSTFRHRNWYDLYHTSNLADAVLAAFQQAPFQSAPGPGPDVLTLSLADEVKKEKEEYVFTVVFSKDGAKLGEAVESCPIKKLTDCTDQLVLDAKTAATN